MTCWVATAIAIDDSVHYRGLQCSLKAWQCFKLYVLVSLPLCESLAANTELRWEGGLFSFSEFGDFV